MGCGKSKHDDVATGNTVVTRKKCIINNTDASKKDTETDLTKSLLVEQKEVSHDHKDELNNENGGGGLISKESPNRFFSSRKEDHEESSSIDGFGLEGKSEKSEYLTPRQEAGKESVFFNDKFEKVDVGVEESTTTTTTGETKIEVGESEKIKEENLMEEIAAEKEKAKDIETEVLSLSAPATANAEKKNLQNDEKEQLIASPTKDDQKTV